MVLNELRHDLQRCVGLLCEVLTEDNTLLYVGSITNYNYIDYEMQIHIHKGDRPPNGVIYNTPVKVRVRRAGGHEQLMIIYGNVLRCAPKFWRIVIEHAVVCKEHRESFRQRVSGSALVAPRRDKESAEEEFCPCDLVDISLSGIAFRSRGVYEVGDHLTLSAVQLTKRGHRYTFHCVVRRVQRDDEKASWSLYGCSLLDINARTESLLSKDIFKLQAQELSAASNLETQSE